MRIVPDSKYNPDLQGYITSKTRLERGITMAKFLGAYGDKTSLKYIGVESIRRIMARNLTLHARAMNLINGNTHRFNDVRLIVSEGIYKRKLFENESEVMKNKAFGNLVYYQVIGTDGDIDFEKTFDVAEYWKDHIDYDELYLDYDDYNPNQSLTAQIGLLMPTVGEDYEVNFSGKISTWFNNSLMKDKELVEIVEDDE
tara:strand:- start:1423 stop:2019 length:597 start_codon:yes stop_codon:yes gene_type:complete